jgi:hypothetical protein
VADAPGDAVEVAPGLAVPFPCLLADAVGVGLGAGENVAK